MNVLLDANVLISAIAGRGLCEAVVEYCLEEHTIIVSEELVQDVRDKLLAKLNVSPTVVSEFCQTGYPLHSRRFLALSMISLYDLALCTTNCSTSRWKIFPT